MAGERGIEDGSIFIGTKPFMNYVTMAVVQLTTKERKEITIKARGKFISRAVDVVEALRKKFLKDKNLEVSNVKIGSEEMERKDGKKINISSIEITLTRK